MTISESYQQLLQKVSKFICDEVETQAKFRELVVEKKEYSITVHFREVKNICEKDIWDFLMETVRKIDEDKMVIKKGKKFFEIMPRIKWNKGYAVKWLLEKYYNSLHPIEIERRDEVVND